MNEGRSLSRGFDHLGEISKNLGDLQGFSTLAYELIQNADDVETATWIRFDVRDEGLVVDNDGVFGDCKRDEEPCGWETERGRRCDFHRFQRIASGDKRGEAGTTGAFGIGFLSVYQVTDYPEVISAGRHWRLREDRHEDDRIVECNGCGTCLPSDLPGTRFMLPWARDRQSNIRTRLRTEAIGPDDPDCLHETLTSLKVALLFLKRLRRIEILRNGLRTHVFEREDSGDSVVLKSHGSPPENWRLFHGDFRSDAGTLRQSYPGKIESKRSHLVQIAIPEDGSCIGLLCACLPTEHKTGLPFHINADFFPKSDRKRIVFDTDIRSRWNRAAITGAAEVLCANLINLRDTFGGPVLWGFIQDIYKVAGQSAPEEGNLDVFWTKVAGILSRSEVILSARGQWLRADRVWQLERKEEEPVLLVLEWLGLDIVHEDLRPYFSLIRDRAVGVPLLDLTRLMAAIRSAGLTRRLAPEELPSWLQSEENWELLWRECAELLRRAPQSTKTKLETDIKTLTLAPGRDGAFWPLSQAFRGDDETTALFEALLPDQKAVFLKRCRDFNDLMVLCPVFDVEQSIRTIEVMPPDKPRQLVAQNALSLETLFGWFDARKKELLSQPLLKAKFAALSIFPTAGTLQPLNKLKIPGGFDDPLGLAELVDLPAVGNHRELLEDLGARPLTFAEYVTNLLPTAVTSGQVKQENLRPLLDLIADRMGELKDNKDALAALMPLSIVQCNDGQWRRSVECYFDEDAVRECLTVAAHIVEIPRERESAFRDLYAWLGVEKQPRLKDIDSRIKSIAAQTYSGALVQLASLIIRHLATRGRPADILKALPAAKTLKWMGARNEQKWYSPAELYAAYQQQLFASQALFVDLPNNVQAKAADFIAELGIKPAPNTMQIVRHLLHLANEGKSAALEIFRNLNDRAGDPAVSILRDAKCLYEDGTYYKPSEVFLSPHRFGAFRHQLGPSLRAYTALLERIGVRQEPTATDALAVLRDIAGQYGEGNQPLESDADYGVLQECWRMINTALVSESLSSEVVQALADVKCVADDRRMLQKPRLMFLENRVGLAAKFGDFLKHNVISPPVDATEAMLAAGARWLGDVVGVEKHHIEGETDASKYASRLYDRRGLFARVMRVQAADTAIRAQLEKLGKLRVIQAESIAVRYRWGAPELPWRHEDPGEGVSALFDAGDFALYFSPNDGAVPWSAFARELALALYPREDPGRYAAGLKEVLMSQTYAEAERNLDDLGIGTIDLNIFPVDESTEPTAQQGEERGAHDASQTDPEGESEPALERPGSGQEAAELLLGQTHTPTPPVAEPGAPEPIARAATPSSATGNGSSPVGGSLSYALASGGAASRSHGDANPAARRVPGSSGARPFISYVAVHPEDDEESDPDGIDYQTRLEIESRAIAFILEREPVLRRTPHNNPGFDLFEPDSDDEPVRWVEVKAMTGTMDDRPVGMSKNEFWEARKQQKAYWLYVVENANSETPNLVRIQDPANVARTFTFDHGWRGVAEMDAP